MDQADWKLRVFYQHQIAKIAKLSRKPTQPAARKRLNFLLNQYIDMLLIMPRPSEREGVETRMQPVLFFARVRRTGGDVTEASETRSLPRSVPHAEGSIRGAS
jgi:hypothetical protein